MSADELMCAREETALVTLFPAYLCTGSTESILLLPV